MSLFAELKRRKVIRMARAIIVVLPFENMSGNKDNEYFKRNGMFKLP